MRWMLIMETSACEISHGVVLEDLLKCQCQINFMVDNVSHDQRLVSMIQYHTVCMADTSCTSTLSIYHNEGNMSKK